MNGEAGRIKEVLKESIPREVFDRTMSQKDERFERAVNQLKATSEERMQNLLKQIAELNDYKIKQEGSMTVVKWLVGIAVAILIGIVISLVTAKK